MLSSESTLSSLRAKNFLNVHYRAQCFQLASNSRNYNSHCSSLNFERLTDNIYKKSDYVIVLTPTTISSQNQMWSTM